MSPIDERLNAAAEDATLDVEVPPWLAVLQSRRRRLQLGLGAVGLLLALMGAGALLGRTERSIVVASEGEQDLPAIGEFKYDVAVTRHSEVPTPSQEDDSTATTVFNESDSYVEVVRNERSSAGERRQSIKAPTGSGSFKMLASRDGALVETAAGASKYLCRWDPPVILMPRLPVVVGQSWSTSTTCVAAVGPGSGSPRVRSSETTVIEAESWTFEGKTYPALRLDDRTTEEGGVSVFVTKSLFVPELMMTVESDVVFDYSGGGAKAQNHVTKRLASIAGDTD